MCSNQANSRLLSVLQAETHISLRCCRGPATQLSFISQGRDAGGVIREKRLYEDQVVCKGWVAPLLAMLCYSAILLIYHHNYRPTYSTVYLFINLYPVTSVLLRQSLASLALQVHLHSLQYFLLDVMHGCMGWTQNIEKYVQSMTPN